MSVGAPGESDQGFGVPADVSNAGEGTQDWSGGLSCSALGRLAGDEVVQEVTASGLGTGLTSGPPLVLMLNFVSASVSAFKFSY